MLAMHDALLRLDAEGREGDVVECGVWMGGHIVLARLVSPKRRCWLFDTFAGMTEPNEFDVKRSNGQRALDVFNSPDRAIKFAGVCEGDVRSILMHEHVYHPELTIFIKGDVCQTLRSEPLPQRIALLRLDTDWHQSTKVELDVLWPRLISGGVCIIDDFGHWAGARKAATEYFSKHVADYANKLRP